MITYGTLLLRCLAFTLYTCARPHTFVLQPLPCGAHFVNLHVALIKFYFHSLSRPELLSLAHSKARDQSTAPHPHRSSVRPPLIWIRFQETRQCERVVALTVASASGEDYVWIEVF